MPTRNNGRHLTCHYCRKLFYMPKSMQHRKYCSNDCYLMVKAGSPDRVKSFWLKVDKTSHPNGCWLFMGCRDKWGYGDLSFAGKHLQAHRLAWKLLRGEPGELDVLHKCHNPSCCNPDHLYLGDDQDNCDDRYAAGRQASKLTAEKAREIKRRYRPGKKTSNAVALAAEYGIAPQTVWNVTSGRSWRDA